VRGYLVYDLFMPPMMLRRPTIAALFLLVIAAVFATGLGRSWTTPQSTPTATPVQQASAGSGKDAKAVLAGGCFWGVEAVFENLTGVVSAVSGYAGGRKSTARYELVSMGMTGHAEAVEVTFDPTVITFGQLLEVFFSVVHDPTQLNRQGPDVGAQYRSSIFYVDDHQRDVARAYIQQLDASRAFPRPIVTTLVPLEGFYPAEASHQNFLVRNPTNPYIVYHDLPKLNALKKQFPTLVKQKAR
jgi:peptide-methionine (S)-S-oxide reductase